MREMVTKSGRWAALASAFGFGWFVLGRRCPHGFSGSTVGDWLAISSNRPGGPCKFDRSTSAWYSSTLRHSSRSLYGRLNAVAGVNYPGRRPG